MEIAGGQIESQPINLSQPDTPKSPKFGIFAIITTGIVVALLIGTSGYIFINKQASKNNKLLPISVPKTESWKGVIATHKGLLVINSNGEVEKDSNQEPKYYLPPGMPPEYFVGTMRWGNFYTTADFSKNTFQLLDNGLIDFIGSESTIYPTEDIIFTATDSATIYKWKIKSSDRPEPVLSLLDGHIIKRFVVSPDKKIIAYVAATPPKPYAEVREAIEAMKDMSPDKLRQLQEEYEKEQRTLTVIDLVSKMKTQTTFPQGRNIHRLMWKGKYLLVLTDNVAFTVYDMTDPLHPSELSNINTPGQIVENLSVSEDGSRFIIGGDYAIRSLPKAEVVRELDRGVKYDTPFQTFGISYQPFSFDDKKITAYYKTEDLRDAEIKELDINTGTYRSLGLLKFLMGKWLPGVYDTTGTNLVFMVYNPSGDHLIFLSTYEDSLDLYSLKIGEKQAIPNNLKDLKLTWQYAGPGTAFLGWYEESN